MKPIIRWNMSDAVYDAYEVHGAASSQLHGHRHFLLTLITKGEGVQILNGETIAFKEGDIFLLSPADFHRNATKDGCDYDFFGVKFNFETLDARLSAIFGLDALPIHLSLPNVDYEKAKLIFKSLVNGEKTLTAPIDELFKKNLVEQLIIIIMRHLDGGNEKTESPFYVRMLEYMYSHFCDSISVGDAAAYVGYTPNHFNTLFRETFGTPFFEYLWQMRLEYAKNLVLSGELSLTEIALESGFLSLAHFSRRFKDQYGKSPSEYRKTVKRQS